jgi:DNA-directed RNA polymerase beta subunit
MERVVRERMSIQDTETLTPQQLINIRPVVASIKLHNRHGHESNHQDLRLIDDVYGLTHLMGLFGP